MDDGLKGFLIASGIVFGLFLVFFFSVVVPEINEKGEQHWACIEKGGVWVDESRACMDPRGIMK